MKYQKILFEVLIDRKTTGIILIKTFLTPYEFKANFKFIKILPEVLDNFSKFQGTGIVMKLNIKYDLLRKNCPIQKIFFIYRNIWILQQIKTQETKSQSAD